ncbi:MAG TPA: hypothetical protein VFR78_20640 [Pyrinomonadaceae bacterium]|nr:hypothetical protein [Pyrinomonadaceae bacterium]
MDPLAPVFAASVAVQQILEAISVFVEERFGPTRKKAILGVIGFLIGLGFASYFDLNVMKYLQAARSGGVVDKILTALMLSAGTEGVNSLVKFLKYLKEDKKATAAETLQMLRKRAAEGAPAVSPRARETLDRLRAGAGKRAPARDGDTTAKTAAETAAFSYISST